MKKTMFFMLLGLSCAGLGHSQEGPSQKWWDGEWYTSWGYNRVAYQYSTIRFEQPTQNNDYVLQDVSAHDAPGYDKIDLDWGHITIPQYSIRIGHVFNTERGLAWEINFDHYKYVVDQDQQVRMFGTYQGQAVDQRVTLSESVLKYRLNNGANVLLLNLVKRFPLYREPYENWSLALLAKAGLGVMIPHTENTVYGIDNQAGYQFGGFGGGVESGLRFVTVAPVYLELGHKLVLLDYMGLHINEGSASQVILAQSFTMSLGLFFNAGKPANPHKEP
jgi:hypothetical protein